MRNALKALVFIAGLVSAQTAEADNLLMNGDFETPVQVAPNFATFNIPAGSSVISNWNVVQGNVDLTTTKNYGPLTNTLDPGSVQDVDLIGDSNGSKGVFGGISQSFSTVAGQTYRLMFDYSHNSGTFSPDYAAQVTVADANAPASSIFSVEVSQVAGPAVWQSFLQDFVATSDSTLLTFIDTRGGFNAGIYLDDVSVELVNAVPLPAALPMFGAGLAALGLVARRRKQKIAA